MPSLEELVHGFFAEMPHPQAPSLRVGEYPVAARMANVLKFGQGHASPPEVENFWREFKQTNQTLVDQKKLPIAPDEFIHLAKQVARSSFAYHGRPPSMHELARLRDADPKTIHDYYGALPDEHYQTVPAAEMAKALHSARPWAEMITGQPPTKLDAAYLYHSGQNPKDFYETRRQHDGDQDSAGADAGATGTDPAGGQQAGTRAAGARLAAGASAAGRTGGVPAGRAAGSAGS